MMRSKKASSWSAATSTVPPAVTEKKVQPVAQWSSALASLTEKFPMASLNIQDAHMASWNTIEFSTTSKSLPHII